MSRGVVCPICLIEVDEAVWSTTLCSGESLFQIGGAIFAAGRRIGKGLPARERIALLQPLLTRCVAAAVSLLKEGSKEGSAVGIWRVPEERVAEWLEMIRDLSGIIAASAAVQARRASVPPFLPMLFPPASAAGLAQAGAYGRFDVASHLELLAPSQDVLGAQSVCDLRAERFRQAVRRGSGLVELALPLVPFRSKEELG